MSLVGQENKGYFEPNAGPSRLSEKVEQIIDEEILEITKNCYEEAKKILQENREKLEKLAQTLLEKEIVEEQEILAILGPRPETLRKI